jgi:NAD(P)H-dependent FMN reductase
MLRVGIITGSTRPNRVNEQVARWALALAEKHGGAEYELVDIADYGLPLLDEPMPPSTGKYTKEHTKRWAAKIDTLDAFVFISPEYNHGVSAALKNAIDFLYKEWNNKVAGFVSYGSASGVRAVEHLRGVMAELQVADVRAQVFMSLSADFENYTVFKPHPRHEKQFQTMLGQVLSWGGALRTVRAGSS